MSAYRKFTPSIVAEETQVSGAAPAKVANVAKVDPATPPALAGLAGLAGGQPQTRESEAAGDWELDPLPLVETHQENIARRRRLGYSESQAARWAYGAALEDWHRQHGAKPLPGHCGGCGSLLTASDNILALPDGAAVHSQTTACLISYGRKRHIAAAAALAELGIHPPPGWLEEWQPAE